jgi:uncharacterized RDD family membrane protein YckC
MKSDADLTNKNVGSQIPQIASFWRRIGAAVIDWIVLGALGACLGFLWFDHFATLGGVGRFIGGAIALVYFSVLNSRIGQGQTLGKRLLKIRVINASGSPVNLPRTTLRSFILLLPATLNGMYFPIEKPGLFMSIAPALCVFGLGGALAYLYCFNRQTRQSAHDLATGSFVVSANESAEIHRAIWKPHLAIVLVWFCVVGVGLIILPGVLGQSSDYQALVELHRAAQSVVPGAQVSVNRGTTKSFASQGGGSTATFLSVGVAVPLKPDSYEALADRMAATILHDLSDYGHVAQMTISVSYGYDILISSTSTTKSFTHSPQEWLKRVRMEDPSHSAT